MIQKHDDNDANTVNELAKTTGLPYLVRLSNEVAELLKPNGFLAGLGIRHDDRINSLLNLLKGGLVPENTGLKDTIPGDGVIFSVPLVTNKPGQAAGLSPPTACVCMSPKSQKRLKAATA